MIFVTTEVYVHTLSLGNVCLQNIIALRFQTSVSSNQTNEIIKFTRISFLFCLLERIDDKDLVYYPL